MGRRCGTGGATHGGWDLEHTRFDAEELPQREELLLLLAALLELAKLVGLLLLLVQILLLRAHRLVGHGRRLSGMAAGGRTQSVRL